MKYLQPIKILLCLLVFTNFIHSQDIGTLRGVLRDASSGEILAFGNVYIIELNIGTSTNERGNFLLPKIPAPLTYSVRLSYVGYNTKVIDVFIEKNRITEIDVELSQGNIELETIEKVADKISKEKNVDVSIQRISIKELESLPKGVELDIFRSLQFLPGVRSTGDVTAKYYVRGSSNNQNLVMINKTTIYNPFHALGMFSIVDPDIINNFSFHKGGFPAEFGGRVSSVLNLITKDGNRNRVSASATSSFLTGKLLVEGPIPNGTFFIAGRKSYSTEILKKFLNYKSAPFDFYDLSFKVNYSDPNFLPDAKFSLHTFLSGDKILNNNPLKEDYKWKNSIIGFTWFNIYSGSPMYSEMGVSLSKFSGELIPNYSNARRRENDLTDISFFYDVTYVFDSRDEVSVGARVEQINSKLKIENANGAVSELNDQGANIGAYVKYKLLSIPRLGIDIGNRFNFTGLSKSKKDIFEPRASISYQLFSNLSLKAAWGIYQQDIVSLSSENDIISLFEPWIIIPSYIESARSIHYITGISSQFGDFQFDLEGYYKIVNNHPVLNDKKYFPTDPDLITGTSESYGMEILTKYLNSPFNITLSYSLSWAYLDVNEWIYYPRYDARHSLNFLFEYKLGNDWTASIVWVFNSGIPFTQNMGYYQKPYFDNFRGDDELPYIFQPQSILFGKNLGRLPTYHRLDLSLSKRIDLNFMKINLDISVMNAYDRKNIFYFERDTGKRVNMLPVLPTATLKVVL